MQWKETGHPTKRMLCLISILVACFSDRVAADETLIVAVRGETGDELLKLDPETLGAVASFEKGFWGPVASILSLPTGRYTVFSAAYFIMARRPITRLPAAGHFSFIMPASIAARSL